VNDGDEDDEDAAAADADFADRCISRRCWLVCLLHD